MEDDVILTKDVLFRKISEEAFHQNTTRHRVPSTKATTTSFQANTARFTDRTTLNALPPRQLFNLTFNINSDGLVGFVDASQADCPDRHNSILMPSGHIMETPDVFIVENLGHGPPLPAPVAPDLYPPYCKATNRASLSSAVKRPAPTAVGEQLAPNPSPKHHPWPHLKWPEHHPRPNLKWPVLRPRLHLR
ncbi:hypothetical protein N7535_002768 [Penicillium sp. DV-2018c]|nr:hypothetical protein N7535_002768 [Penicillium sp. DV-2018c]